MYILFYAQIYSHRYFFTYHKGYSVYADGKIEQWGNTTPNGVMTINFSVPFSQMPSISVCGNHNANYSVYWACLGYDLNTSSFKVNLSTPAKMSWYAIGY